MEMTETTPPVEQAVSRSFVSERLVRGLEGEELKQFEGSYKRAKKILQAINEYATKEAESKMGIVDSPTSLNAPHWDKLMAWASGYRFAMKNIQEITRT